jgi:hypothetical protein
MTFRPSSDVRLAMSFRRSRRWHAAKNPAARFKHAAVESDVLIWFTWDIDAGSNVRVELRAAASTLPKLLYPNSSIPPALNEDDAARPLQRKLDGSRPNIDPCSIPYHVKHLIHFRVG